MKDLLMYIIQHRVFGVIFVTMCVVLFVMFLILIRRYIGVILQKWFPIENKLTVLSELDDIKKRVIELELKSIVQDKRLIDVESKIDKILLATHINIFYMESASLSERIRAGYEYFLSGGNHGVEMDMVELIRKNGDNGKKEWWKIDAEMKRTYKILTGNIKAFQFIEDSLR